MKKTSISNKLINHKDIIERLVRVNKLTMELHKLTSHTAIGELTGVTKQAIQYQAKKRENHE